MQIESEIKMRTFFMAEILDIQKCNSTEYKSYRQNEVQNY